MKNQISFLTHLLSIILLLCFALGPCTAHNKNDKPDVETTTKSSAPEAEPPSSSFGLPPSGSPKSENPTTSSESSSSKDDSEEDESEHSYTSFSTAFADILKGTLRGNTITMPEHDASDSKSDHHSVKEICSHTDYPEVCVHTIAPFIRHHHVDLMNVLEAAIKACSDQANFTISTVLKHMHASPEMAAALSACKEQYTDALENLHRAMEAIPSRDLGTVTVMLSAVMADVSACESGFDDLKKASPMGHSEGMVSITASNCLAIASLIPY